MISEALLCWYDANKRSFPFRGPRDPYRVWVSEIMLQQTRTDTVSDYYIRFIERFPNVHILAEADEQELLKVWQGLGYYSRARNLHKAAKIIDSEYEGVFPRDIDKAVKLPGIGAYTAAAILSIAYDLPYPAMDGNLTRVFSRIADIRENTDEKPVRELLMRTALSHMPPTRCGDFNQALMDLGATICVPGTPDCSSCPISSFCAARKAGSAALLPVKNRTAAPVEVDVKVFVITDGKHVLMRQRKDTLLKGMWTYYLTENDPAGPEEILRRMELTAFSSEYLGEGRHIFSHRVWNMRIWYVRAEDVSHFPPDCRFITKKERESLPIPTAMRPVTEKLMRIEPEL